MGGIGQPLPVEMGNGLSFDNKRLKITIQLGAEKDAFDDDGNNTIVFDGLRTSCNINYGNGAVMPNAQIRIYGLNLENMMKLLRVQWNTKESLQNLIKVEAGDSTKTSIVYMGNITFAKPDFGGAPNVALVIDSNTAIRHQLMPVPARSFEGEVDVADAIKLICNDMGYIFENNGVTVKLSNPYQPNTALQQIQSLANAADIDLYIEQNIVAIAPRDVPRNIEMPVIKPDSGLIGYPVPDLIGVQFSCLYDPALRFGGLCEIQNSIIAQCNGQWRVFGMSMTLESMTPGGKWQVDIKAAPAKSENKNVAK